MPGATSDHFQEWELACHHCGLNFATPALVDALEALRALLPRYKDSNKERALRIIDGCRCPAWNEKTPNAASHSQHMLGTAADVWAAGMTAAELYALAVKVPAFANGGIGRNDPKKSLHVDIRDQPARWCYAATGATLKWYEPDVLL